MDIVGRELSSVLKYFDSMQIPYEIETTRADRCRQTVDFDNLYVIRQRVDAQGIHQILVCGKMGREGLIDHGL